MKALAAALVLAAGTATPLAAGPQIEACVREATGFTRIVLHGEACQAGERRVVWSVQGPAGAPGADGAPGPAGVPGAPGAAGPPGPSPKSPCERTIGRVTFSGLTGGQNDPTSDLSALQLNVKVAHDPSGTAQPQFGPLTLSKPADGVSPRLLLAAATLSALTAVQIDIFRQGTPTPAVTYVLHDPTFVSAFHYAPSGLDVLCEDIELDFCKVEVTSFPEQGPPTTILLDRCNTGGV